MLEHRKGQARLGRQIAGQGQANGHECKDSKRSRAGKCEDNSCLLLHFEVTKEQAKKDNSHNAVYTMVLTLIIRLQAQYIYATLVGLAKINLILMLIFEKLTLN